MHAHARTRRTWHTHTSTHTHAMQRNAAQRTTRHGTPACVHTIMRARMQSMFDLRLHWIFHGSMHMRMHTSMHTHIHTRVCAPAPTHSCTLVYDTGSVPGSCVLPMCTASGRLLCFLHTPPAMCRHDGARHGGTTAVLCLGVYGLSPYTCVCTCAWTCVWTSALT